MALFGFFTKSADFSKSSIDGMNIVKPSANLANIFNNEVSWVVSFKFLFIFKRIVELSEWHRAGFKPTVEDFFDTSEML